MFVLLRKFTQSMGFSGEWFSKRKVLSGFGLGVIASILLLTVLFLYGYPPVFRGGSWYFQFPSNNKGENDGVGSTNNQTQTQTQERTSPPPSPAPELSKTPPEAEDGGGVGEEEEEELSGACDVFDGSWVRDEGGEAYYPAGSCPHIDKEEDCHRNGRPDTDFIKWRWQPKRCTIPRLNATDFLERLRGKRLVFVGDSLNRNMWQSLVCILRQSVADKKKVYEVSGQQKFKKKGIYAFHFEDFNCFVDFVTAPYLVRVSSAESVETLRLDLIDSSTSFYEGADIIIFNTGHWWTHPKPSKGENYYQEGNHVYPKLQVMEAYNKALTTWAKWVDDNVNTNKSQVFFRGYSGTHFRGSQWNSSGQCYNETEPIHNDKFLGKYPPKMRTLEHVLEQMKTPVVYLNISKLTDYRKDAHPSIYKKQHKTEAEKHAAERSQDCSHWCLPGVPDTWNELLYASLLRDGKGSWRK